MVAHMVVERMLIVIMLSPYHSDLGWIQPRPKYNLYQKEKKKSLCLSCVSVCLRSLCLEATPLPPGRSFCLVTFISDRSLVRCTLMLRPCNSNSKYFYLQTHTRRGSNKNDLVLWK